MLNEHGSDVEQLIAGFIFAHCRSESVPGHFCDYHLSNAGGGHYFTFKYELIARRTISASETFSRLAAALNALICPASINAINLLSFMALTYNMDMYMSSTGRLKSI
jgi:hypothetical protein